MGNENRIQMENVRTGLKTELNDEDIYKQAKPLDVEHNLDISGLGIDPSTLAREAFGVCFDKIPEQYDYPIDDGSSEEPEDEISEDEYGENVYERDMIQSQGTKSQLSSIYSCDNNPTPHIPL